MSTNIAQKRVEDITQTSRQLCKEKLKIDIIILAERVVINDNKDIIHTEF